MGNNKKDLGLVLKEISSIKSVKDIWSSIIAIVLAFLVSSVIILLMNESPIEAYSYLIQGAFGNTRALYNTIAMSIPLMFTGLAVAVASRGGLFNIGAEGQLYIGSMCSVLTALAFPGLPKPVLLPLILIAGFAGGAVWGLIPGYLKAVKGINEVIVCIMLNYVAQLFTSYLVNGPFKDEGMQAHTKQISENARFVRYTTSSQLTNAVFVAILIIVCIYILLWKTSAGFKIRTVGLNFFSSEAAGINPKITMIATMALSGGIASMAGVTEITAKYYRFVDTFSPSYGFTGIAVAVLGRNNPFGIILTSLLFGMLDSGALRMTLETSISSSMIKVIQSLVILFVAAPQISRIFSKKVIRFGNAD